MFIQQSMSESELSEDTSTDNTLTEVNGQDLTNASHEDSLKALQSAPQPIIIEVLRRAKSPQADKTTRTIPTSSPVTTSTQTESCIADEYCSLLDAHSAALQEMYPFIPGAELMQPSCRQGVCFSPSVELGLTDIEMANEDDDEPIYDDPWDIARPSFLSGLEIEYEDVTLLRNNSDDKLGLTLCYENHGQSEEDEPLTDVYVSEIEADSIAAQNGRIREGDQILQINNTEIHSRDQAIKLFSENTSEVTVTVARHVLQVDDGFVEDKHGAPYNHFPMLDARQRPEFLDVRMFEGLEGGGSTDTASTSKSKQDSGLGRTDDSVKAESSEHECLDTDCQERCCHSNDSFTSNDTPDSMSPDQAMFSNQVLPGYNCDKTSDALGKDCTYSNCDHGCTRNLNFHGNVAGKPPRSPSNKSDSAVCISSGNTSSKSDSSSQSSPSSAYPNPCDHIYDEPICNDINAKTNTNISYRNEIDELNQEIENMRIECRKMHDSNRAEVHKACAPNKLEQHRSPRVVPRMGTRLEYLRQTQTYQNFSQMGSLLHNSHTISEMNGNVSGTKGTGTNSNPPYCVAMVTPPDVTSQTHTDTNEYMSTQTDNVEYKDSSNTSAYNTGESCRSTPLRLELQPRKPEVDGGGGWNMSMLSLAVSNVQGGARTPPSDDDAQEIKLRWCKNNSLVKTDSKRDSNSDKRKGKASVRARPKDGEKCPMVQTENGSTVSHMTQTPADHLRALYTQYADVMYTNQANLQHTMELQQKLFQQQLLVQKAKQTKYKSNQVSAHKSQSSDSTDSKRHKSHVLQDHSQSRKKSKSQSSSNRHNSVPSYPNQSVNILHSQASPNELCNSLQPTENATGKPCVGQGSSGSDNGKMEKFEWVVKMRPDGSRYITRRPVRNKILRERAKKLNEERCGMTTDDDAISELKVGRYWSKDERKRHLEKAREYKRKKEQALKQKAEALKESDERLNKEPNILELSHKKMMKAKNKKTLDDFTTVQEMMVHGSRHVETVTKAQPTPLLSVTTV